tara:strand:+ start:271 stop:639 length:369 start_codon:yes stop_codon:yes gene_type:complete
MTDSDNEENIDSDIHELDISEPNEMSVINKQTEDIDIFLQNYDTNKKNNKTAPYLNKYERTRILSERAQQIIDGGVIFISHPETYKNAYDIAVQELSERKIPFIIKRPYNNTFEYWKLEDLL